MTEKSPAVSVVVPVYNAEKYLPVCLESILIQTLTDFEVIVVNDASTDRSLTVAENYLERFGGRMKIISLEENTGSGAVPRNVGLDFARGKYVFFTDADDLLVDNALETLFDFAENFRADVVCLEKFFTCGVEPVPKELADEISLINPRFLINEPAFETNDLVERTNRFLRSAIGYTPWTKFLRLDFLVDKGIKFPAIRISEDIVWTFKIVCLAKKILHVPNILYIYRNTDTSMVRRARELDDEIKFWLSPLISGVDCLNDFMDGIDLFNHPNNLRLRVLNFFANVQFDFMAKAFKQLDRHEVYKIFVDELRKSDGDHSALIAYLLVMTNIYRGEPK